MLELADRMLGYDRLSDAYRYVMLAESVGGFDSSMLSKIKKTAGDVKTAADELIEEADQYCADGQYAEAIDAYSRVSGLRKMGSSKTATRKLIELQRNPAVRTSLREIKATRRLEKVLEMVDITAMDIEIVVDDPLAVCEVGDLTEAIVAEGQPSGGPDYAVFPPPDMTMAGGLSGETSDEFSELGLTEVEVALLLNLCDRIKFIDALDSVADHYEDTASGQRASALSNQLRASTEFMDGLEEHRLEEEAMECLSMGQQYEQVGLLELAEKMYNEAVQASPESEWGVAAKVALAELKQ